MTDQPVAIAAESIKGVENALRDAAARSMKPEMPLPLALQFYKSVIGLARCLRQCRKMAGLPVCLSLDLMALLSAVRISASCRLNDTAATDAQAIRLLGIIEKLMQAVLLAAPVPEKPKKLFHARVARPTVPAEPLPTLQPWQVDALPFDGASPPH
jgi:hypothetical protein